MIRHDCIPALRQDRLGGFFNVAQEMARSLRSGHPRVDKPDQVRKSVVAEDQVHRGLAVFIAMNVVEPPGQFSRQAAVAIAREKHSCAAPEHAFVGCHPLNT